MTMHVSFHGEMYYLVVLCTKMSTKMYLQCLFLFSNQSVIAQIKISRLSKRTSVNICFLIIKNALHYFCPQKASIIYKIEICAMKKTRSCFETSLIQKTIKVSSLYTLHIKQRHINWLITKFLSLVDLHVHYSICKSCL